MKARWAGIVSVSLGLLPAAFAEDGPPARSPNAVGVALSQSIAEDESVPENCGRQVASPGSRPAAVVVRAQCDDGFQPIIPQAPSSPPATVSTNGQPVFTVAGQAGCNASVPPTNPIPPPGGLSTPSVPPATGCIFALSGTRGGGRGDPLEGDHCFDTFISPVTNPFLFEDPRATTEIRPIYIGQATPHNNWIYDGGSINALNFLGSVAFDEEWSLTFNKFGWIWNAPANGQGLLGQHVGFEELWLGPKWTFLRSENTGTVMAAGLIFQLPVGSSKVVQDTGVLTLTPYITFAQNLVPGWNFLTTFGYALATDDKRSDYFYNSYHLDYDVGGLHQFYPLVELNWFHYTTAGSARDFGFEGLDLINFGSSGVSGDDSLTLALGMRYRFDEHVETGFATEFPLIASKDLLNFRFTLDVIFRY